MTETIIDARESVAKAIAEINTTIWELEEQRQQLSMLLAESEKKSDKLALSDIKEAIIGTHTYENGMQFHVVSLALLRPDVVGRTVNAIFDAEGWQVHLLDSGFQIYFGKGVQVDNNYEFGFPHTYDLDSFMGWVDSFYRYRLYEKVC